MATQIRGIFDSHAHYFDRRFEAETGGADAILSQIMPDPVAHIVNVGTNPENSAEAVKQAARYAGMFAAVGIHPEDCHYLPDEQLAMDRLQALLGTPESRRRDKIVALGEIGLDYAVTGDSVLRTAQRHWFEQQMELAADRSLPVIIHCVRAYNDLIPILRHYPHVTPVIHGFTGSPELAERLLQAGGYLSFGHRTAASPKTRQALAAVPVDRVFFETDESPLPIAATYATAAAITGKTVAEWKETVYDNYRRLFKTP